MKKSRLAGLVVGIAMGVMLAAPVAATPLTASFVDPTGDGNLKGDVVGATLTFDNVTGDYQVRWRATAADPFSGDADAATEDLQLNLNLGNARLGANVLIPARFSVLFSTTELVVNGTDANFIGWLEGDSVVTFGDVPTFPFEFYSGLVDLRVNDLSDRDRMTDRSVLISLGDTPSTVSAPTALLNAALGLAMLGLVRRWRARPLWSSIRHGFGLRVSC